MEIDEQHVTDYWHVVRIEFENEEGNIGAEMIHSQYGELESLRDDILSQLEEHVDAGDWFRDDEFFESEDLDGIPDERMVARDYSHKVVALFAISCGTMEKQLEILNSIETHPEILEGLESTPFNSIEPSDLVDSYFDGRGLHENLEFAKVTGVVDQGTYSEANDVRKTRNRLVHNPLFRLSIESYDAHRQRISKAVSAPNRIDGLLQEVVSQ